MVRARAIGVLGLALSVPACGDGDAPPTARPAHSLILVTIDTTRADRIGCYGAGAAVGTPQLDAFAAEGARCVDARTPVPLTLPSHATLLTGLYPPGHGLRDNGLAALSSRAETLADVLSARGMRTGAFVSAFVLDARFGLDQGFEEYDDVADARQLDGGLMQERPADATVDAALAWLAGVEGSYFLWVHLFDPHSPYAPPAPFAGAFPADPYQGEIAFADAQVGRLLEAARARPGPAPVVVVTSDHGESLGEHGEPTHGAFVYDATLDVPLLVAGPGVAPGSLVDRAVSTADVLPTVLELLGVPAPVDLDGVSFAPLLRGEDAPPRGPVYFESYWGFLNQGWSPLLGVTDGRQKLIDAPSREHYDLTVDPDERANRYGEDGALAERMLRAAHAIHASTRDLAEERVLTPEERRTLDEMGYVSGGVGGEGVPLPDPSLPDPKDRIHLQRARDQVLALLSRHDRTGDPALLQEGLAILAPALAEDPQAAGLNEFAGLILARQGRCAEAVPHLRACLERRPDNLDARYALAYSLRYAGDPDAAVAELERCLDEEPAFAKAARLLGNIHEDRGNVPGAILWYERFLERWTPEGPERDDVRARLLRLRERSGRRG